MHVHTICVAMHTKDALENTTFIPSVHKPQHNPGPASSLISHTACISHGTDVTHHHTFLHSQVIELATKTGEVPTESHIKHMKHI